MDHKKWDIELISHLAMLSLSPEELSSLDGDMEAIVAFADKISDAPTEDVSKAQGRENVYRTLARARKIGSDALLRSAPEGGVKDGYFAVPKAVD